MSESAPLFPITSQTLLDKVQSSDVESRFAGVTHFASVYGPALFGFIRSLGRSVEDAEDLVQDFFVRVIEDELLDKFDRSRGSRLSSWLIKLLSHQVFSENAARKTLKRGGHAEHVEFDAAAAEVQHHQLLHLALQDAEMCFDLGTARSMWSRAMEKLRNRYCGKPEMALVADLEPFILLHRWPGSPAPSQSAIAHRHGRSPLQVKAFFSRTLRMQAEKAFTQEARASSPGITDEDVLHLWELLRAHA